MTRQEPFRILEVIASVDPAGGGPVEGLLRQDEITRPMGVVREVVSCDPADAAFLRDFPMVVHAMGADRPAPGPLGRYMYTPKLIPWLRAFAANYDAVVVNGLWNFSTLAAAMTLPGRATPYYVYTHGMLDPWFKRTYPRKHLAKQGFWLFSEGRLLSGARAVLFTTEEERQLAKGQFRGWSSYDEAVVGYGTSAPPAPTAAQTAAFEAATPDRGDRPYLLFLSRIHRKKGCDLLVEAFAKVASIRPDLDLVIAGPDQEGLAPTLKRRADELGVGGRIHWPGMLQGDAKWGAYRGAEAFILPSHQENFGVVVAEALACGTPVLLTDKVNIWREVDEGGGGLVATDTVEGVQSLLERWMKTSMEDRRRMGERAKSVFLKAFDTANVAPAVVQVLRNGVSR